MYNKSTLLQHRKPPSGMPNGKLSFIIWFKWFCLFSNNTLSQVNEFLKLKPTSAKLTQATTLKRKEPAVKIIETSPPKKQKINLVLASSPVQQQAKVQQPSVTTITPTNTIVTNAANKTQAITLQDLKFLSGNKCYVPITLKDGSNNDQQVMAQIDTKNLVLPTTYLQMKLEPQQITTVDGQQVVQLTSASNLPTSISLAQPQFVQAQINENMQQTTMVPESRTIFAGGQNITITQQPQHLITTQNIPTVQSNAIEAGKVQFTTLQNVVTPNITLPMPESSAITLQRIKVEPGENKQTIISNVAHNKQAPKQQVFKLPTLPTTTTTTLVNNSNAVNKPKVTARKSTARVAVVTSKPANRITAVSKTANSSANTTTTTSSSGTSAATDDTKPKSEVPTCEICEKVFKRKEHLAQHVKLHLGLRPFKCEEPNCNKASIFTYMRYLNDVHQ